MNLYRSVLLLGLSTLLAATCVVPVLAQTTTGSGSATGFTYQVPLRGAPATRVGGGTRGTENDLQVEVLAPGETGFTVQNQPSVYWYLSARTELPVEITISPSWPPEAASNSLVEVIVPPPIDRGVHELDLAEHGVTLSPDVEYAWFVAVVKNPEQRADDIVAGGTIQLINLPQSVMTKATRAEGLDRAAAYASAGVWYDAIEELSGLIETAPGDSRPRAARAALLEQVGLTAAAAYDSSEG